MADTLQERMVEVIGDNIYAPLKVRRFTAAEIEKLLEAEDKTLTLMASEAGIPLYRAMRIADYGKKANMEMVNQVGEEYLVELEREKENVWDIDILTKWNNKIDGVKELLRRLK